MAPVPSYSRSWRQIVRASSNPMHYIALRNARVYRHPIDSFIRRYVMGRGAYPTLIPLSLPSNSTLNIGVRSRYDLLTIHEIFVWQCYPANGRERLIVDLGANVGISMLFFLSRAPNSRVIGLEPLSENVIQARTNLKDFEERSTLIECAAMNYDGVVEMGVEETGRYSGIDQTGGSRRTVPCVNFDRLLMEIAKSSGRVDLLKIDVEGAEGLILRNLSSEAYGLIDSIAVEGEAVPYDCLSEAGFTHTLHPSGVHWFRRTHKSVCIN